MNRGYTKRLIGAALNLKETAKKRPPGSQRQITIETHKVLVVHQRGSFLTWCVGCGGTVEMVTPEEAAAFLQISLRRIFRRIEADRLHFTENPDGSLFICRNSLTNLNLEVNRK